MAIYFFDSQCRNKSREPRIEVNSIIFENEIFLNTIYSFFVKYSPAFLEPEEGIEPLILLKHANIELLGKLIIDEFFIVYDSTNVGNVFRDGVIKFN
jgi:hypothetical protein